MQTRSSRQHRSNSESSDRVTSRLQTRPWSDPLYEQPWPHAHEGFDLSNLDMWSHDPGPREYPRVNQGARSPVVQAKLTVGAPNDPYEQEADRVAEQVVNTIHQPQGQPSVQREELPDDDELQMKPASIQREELPDDDELQMKPASIQRTELPDDDELQMKPASIQRTELPDDDELQMKPASVQRTELPDDDELQMKPASVQQTELPDDDELQMKPLVPRQADGGGEASAELEAGIASARGGGQALEPGLQRQMGQAMGADFSGVRVHTDAQADQLNQSIQAKAFTTGQDVFFRQGAYEPGSRGGQELIAHELTHVVQQTGRRLETHGTQDEVSHQDDPHPASVLQTYTHSRNTKLSTSHAMQRKSTRVLDGAAATNISEGFVQRRVYLPPFGVDDLEQGETEKEKGTETTLRHLDFESVMGILKLDKIIPNAAEKQVISEWCTDAVEHLYHGFYDLKEFITDVKSDVPASKRQWVLGLDPKAFAWRKLVGSAEDGFGERQRILTEAKNVVLHPNTGFRPKAGEHINKSGDFPVEMVTEKDTVHATNILGAGRMTETRSYLEMVGVEYTVAEEEATDVARELTEKLSIKTWPEKFSLSIMPISVVFDIDRNSASVKATDRGAQYPYARVEVGHENHVICDIKWANGEVVEHLLRAIRNAGKALTGANLHGICGALGEKLRRNDMVIPKGRVHSLDKKLRDGSYVIKENAAVIPGGTCVVGHGHVTTIMQEDDESLSMLLDKRAVQTLEMEALHLIRGIEAIGYAGPVKIVFTVSDVWPSKEENLGVPEEKSDKTLEERAERNAKVIATFGLGKSFKKELKV